MYKQTAEIFASQLSKISELGPEASEALAACVEVRHFPRKSLLHEPGQVSGQIFYIGKGLVREYFHDDKGNDISVWFGKEEDFAVLLSSFVTGTPSQTGLQALEATDGFSISRERLYELYDRFHEVERLGRILTERYFVASEAYNRGFHYLDARKRYEMFALHNPELMQRLPLRYIASYVGVSIETLSRLRARIF